MKLFLLCITSIFFLFFFQSVEKQSENVPVQSENEVVRIGNEQGVLQLKLATIYHHLKNAFSPVTDDNLSQGNQGKGGSFLYRLKNNVFYDLTVCLSFYRGNRQFRDFLSTRHLHGFYIFFLAKLIV